MLIFKIIKNSDNEYFLFLHMLSKKEFLIQSWGEKLGLTCSFSQNIDVSMVTLSNINAKNHNVIYHLRWRTTSKKVVSCSS